MAIDPVAQTLNLIVRVIPSMLKVPKVARIYGVSRQPRKSYNIPFNYNELSFQ